MVKKLGHYDIVSELGRGGMGVVYKAYEASLDRHVAIKVLSEQMASDPTLVARFQREARSVAALNHPHIIQIFFIGQSEEQHYFVMEFVEGESLSAYIRREYPLPVPKAMSLLKQAAEGLAAAHEIGVIHRDIKPANLMLDRAGRVKIADFGIAYTADLQNKLTATGQFLGTPGYLSPEVCMGEKADARTDIFSLGVVFFEMLTGKVPFHADSPLAMLSKVVQEAIPDVRSYNAAVMPEIQAILNKMVEKSPDQRFQNCRELIAALDHQLGLAPTQAVDHHAMTAPTEIISQDSFAPPPPPVAPPMASVPPPPAPAPPLGPTVAAMRPPPPQAIKKKTNWLLPVLIFLFLPAVAAGGYFLWKNQNQPTKSDSGTIEIAGLDHETPTNSSTNNRDPEPEGNSLTMAELKDIEDLPLKPQTEASRELGAAAAEQGQRASLPTGEESQSQPQAEGPEASHFEAPSETETMVVSTESLPRDQTSEMRTNSAKQPAVSDSPAEQIKQVKTPTGNSVKNRPSADVTPVVTKNDVRAKNATPQVLLVVSGDAWIGKTVARTLTEALEGQNFELMDPDMLDDLDLWVGEESVKVGGLSKFAYGAGADLLVLAEIQFLGERELNYLGRQTTAYKSALTIRALDLASRKKLNKGWQTELEYTQVNATKKAEEACREHDRELLKTLGQAADKLR